MKLQLDIHPAQAEILNALLFTPEARFSDLNLTGLTNDHFTFHIKRLAEIGLVEKTSSSLYKLTTLGKEFANRMDTDEKVIERQAKLGALLVPIRGQGGQTEYLVQQRLKHPFYGFYGFMTGKMRWGEKALETAARELDEETGLRGDLKLVGVYHKLDYSKQNELLEDKYFYVTRATNLTGKLVEKFEGGQNFWMTATQISSLEKVFEGMHEVIAMAEREDITFAENTYTYTPEEY